VRRVIADLERRLDAAALVERHFEDLSAEVIRRPTRYLPGHEGYVERKRTADGRKPRQ